MHKILQLPLVIIFTCAYVPQTVPAYDTSGLIVSKKTLAGLSEFALKGENVMHKHWFLSFCLEKSEQVYVKHSSSLIMLANLAFIKKLNPMLICGRGQCVKRNTLIIE